MSSNAAAKEENELDKLYPIASSKVTTKNWYELQDIKV
jgi:hypothetical protein